MEILNRREQVAAASLPPEIVDASAVVKKTDYATASKAGVVKVGNNIDVSSGKISVPAASGEVAGVVKVGANLTVDENGALNASAGGITVDELWTGNISTDYLDITNALAHPITDYKFLCVSLNTGSNVLPSQFLYVPNMSTATYNSNYINFGTNNCNLRLGDGTVSIQGAAGYNGIKLLGIK